MAKALEAFRVRLGEIETSILFVATAGSLRPRLGPLLNWQAPRDSIALAQQFMNLDQRVEDVYGSLLLRVTAAFERFTRGLIGEAVLAQCKKASKYDQLSAQVKTRHTALTGQLLATFESPRGHVTVDVETLVRNLASCLPGTSKYQLNEQSFTFAISGISSDTLEKALHNIGIDAFWDDVGSAVPLQTLLGTKGARATGKLARTRLDDLYRWRNHLAHGGDEEIAFTEDKLRECVDVVRGLAEALDVVVLGPPMK